MGLLNLTKEEREAIHKQHEEATKKHNERKAELKKGIQPVKKEKNNEKGKTT